VNRPPPHLGVGTACSMLAGELATGGALMAVGRCGYPHPEPHTCSHNQGTGGHSVGKVARRWVREIILLTKGIECI